MSAIASEKENLTPRWRSRRPRWATSHLGFDHATGTRAPGSASRGNIWTADGCICGWSSRSRACRRAEGHRLRPVHQLLEPDRRQPAAAPPGYEQYVPSPTAQERRGDVPAGRHRLRSGRRPVARRAARGWRHEARDDGAALRSRPALAGAALLTGCELRRCLRPAPARVAGRRGRRLRGHRRVPRRPQRRPALAGHGRRRPRRRGHRGRAGRLARRGGAAGQGRRRAPGQRDRRDPPDQPARREVRRARGADRAGAPTGRLEDGDDIPLVGHRTQPRGRGGPRRAVLPAQRRRRRPARHDHPGAQRDHVAAARTGCETCSARSSTWSARSTTRRTTSSARWSRSTTWQRRSTRRSRRSPTRSTRSARRSTCSPTSTTS